MGGIFGAIAEKDIARDLFFGVDYHSHLGTKRGGLAVIGTDGKFHSSIHDIQSSPFRTKFEKDMEKISGNSGIGCISDYESQPLITHSHLGIYAITTVGLVSNKQELIKEILGSNQAHFLEMSGEEINQTELLIALINQKDSILEGVKFVYEKIKGSITMLILTKEGLYGVRDKYGRTPLHIGKKEENTYCLSFESHAYINLGYKDVREIGPGEVVYIGRNSTNCNKIEVRTLKEAEKINKICAFLWIYYGYPSSSYEGVNVENLRYLCGKSLAVRDEEDGIKVDTVAGVPDSGTAYAIGYSNYSHIPLARPFIKYTPTWTRSFMPVSQDKRNLTAHMKLIPLTSLIKGKRLLLIDDSIVRGTQLRETTDFLYNSGAKEVNIRVACPPITFICPYLNFSRSSSVLDLITRNVINELEGGNLSKEILLEYSDEESKKHKVMVEKIRQKLHFTTLKYNKLSSILHCLGGKDCSCCTYCWSGRE